MLQIEVRTEKMTYGGHALARHMQTTGQEQVLFIPYALPNERVQVKIKATSKRWQRAELIAIIEPSPDRISAPCPHFGAHRCGGCHWQHARYEAQLRYKQTIVEEQLRRIGKIDKPPVAPCLGMREPWHYRTHVQLRHSAEGLGFVRADHQGIYPIDSCLVMNRAITPLFEGLQATPLPPFKRLILRGSDATNERMAIVEGGSARPFTSRLPEDSTLLERQKQGRLKRLRGAFHYHELVGERRWQIHANSFFQVNTQQAENLLATVISLMTPLRGDEVIVDAYAGVGLFGLSVAAKVGHVFLIESHPNAVASAHHHATSFSNITVLHMKTEKALSNWLDRPSPDWLLLDPPRAGCHPSVLRHLGKMDIPNLIYVSCDPSTQSRDIRHLLTLGYQLDIVQPIDLFPHTYHIESVAKLRRP